MRIILWDMQIGQLIFKLINQVIIKKLKKGKFLCVIALPENWNKDGVKARLEKGEQTLHFSDVIPENLKKPGEWIIHYTDDPTLPLNQWQKIPADASKLDKVIVADLIPGTPYHIVIENPKEGITSPEFVTTAPSKFKLKI